MKQRRYVLVGIIAVIVVVLVITAIKHSNNTNSQTGKHVREVTVKLNTNGFIPKQITITAGTTVKWKNISGVSQSINTNTHQVNAGQKELDFNTINNGATVQYTFTIPGTYNLYNQAHPDQKIRVIVVK